MSDATPTSNTPKRAAQLGYHIALIAGVVAALANPGTEVNVPSNPDIVRRVAAIEAKIDDPDEIDRTDRLRREVSALSAKLDMILWFRGPRPLTQPRTQEVSE